MATNITIDSWENCTSVTPECPVQGTTYGYTPNLVGNTVLLAVFSVAAIAQLFLAIKTRLPTFGTVVTAGCVTEAIGYGGRLIMNDNPWNDTAFKIQVRSSTTTTVTVPSPSSPPLTDPSPTGRLPHRRPLLPRRRNLPHPQKHNPNPRPRKIPPPTLPLHLDFHLR